jgi:hypothetical protein
LAIMAPTVTIKTRTPVFSFVMNPSNIFHPRTLHAEWCVSLTPSTTSKFKHIT